MLLFLEREGVDPSAIDFENTQKDEVYCLEEHLGRWRYYYRERGIRRDEQIFLSEDEACKYFIGIVLKDPTSRVRNVAMAFPVETEQRNAVEKLMRETDDRRRDEQKENEGVEAPAIETGEE